MTEATVWGYAQKMSGRQIKAMPDEMIAAAVRLQVEVMERKAAEVGVGDDQIVVMILGEWVGVGPEED